MIAAQCGSYVTRRCPGQRHRAGATEARNGDQQEGTDEIQRTSRTCQAAPTGCQALFPTPWHALTPRALAALGKVGTTHSPITQVAQVICAASELMQVVEAGFEPRWSGSHPCSPTSWQGKSVPSRWNSTSKGVGLTHLVSDPLRLGDYPGLQPRLLAPLPSSPAGDPELAARGSWGPGPGPLGP